MEANPMAAEAEAAAAEGEMALGKRLRRPK
jgi:hypothetical protein